MHVVRFHSITLWLLFRFFPTTARSFYDDYFNYRPIFSSLLWTVAVYLGGVIKNKFDHVILTLVGFCVISLWSFSGFFSNHKKALLRWLLHLHVKFQPISSSSLPCRHDRPSIFFYLKNQSKLCKSLSDSNQNWCTLIIPLCVASFNLIEVCVCVLWAKVQSVRNEE